MAFDHLFVARNRASIFDRLKSDDVEAFLEKSIHTRKDKKSKEASQKKRLGDPMINEFKEIQNAIHSRMKRKSNWVVTAGETLKGKQHTIVTTRQAFKDGGNEEMKVLSSNHISVE